MPAMNNAREVVFAATLLGQGVNTENDSGIWPRTLGRNGLVLNNLVREGNPPDSTRPDILRRSFGEPVLNWAGQVAFSGSVRGPGIGQANDTGLWVPTLRSVVQVTQEDQQAFGTAAGVRWSGFGEPALNVQGHVAFTGTLRGQGVGGANDSGLWVITPDSFPLLDPSGVLTNRILVAREGDLAADGAGAKWNSFGEPVLNSSGQLALSATLTGAGVSEREAGLVARRVAPTGTARVTYRVEPLSPLTIHSLMKNWRSMLDSRLVKQTKRHSQEVTLGEVLVEIRQTGAQSVELDILEGGTTRLRPASIVRHIVNGDQGGLTDSRVCRMAIRPVEEQQPCPQN